MTMNLNSRIAKKIAVFFIVIFLSEIIFPTAALALTGGPTQPEFSSFEPVATTNMVNEFTGDLTYNLPVINIPGAEGGGYALSLSYHSGTAVEEEASWVGYGWTLNPGAITRNKRGFADDWNGEEVKIYNKTKPSRTVTLGGSLGDLEVYSVDLSFNGNASLRYNNYKGFGYTLGLGVATTDGVFSLGFHLSDGEGSFSAQVSPGGLLNGKKDKAESAADWKKKQQEDKKKGPTSKADREKQAKDKKRQAKGLLNALGSSGYGIMNLASSPSPQYSTPFDGESFRLNVTFQIDPSPLEISPFSGNLFGSYSTQRNTEVRTQHAYGYMYSKQAWNDNLRAMDYGVERPSGYNRFDKVLPVPYSSTDSYSLSGEGLGGGFRMYNKKMGHYTPSPSESHTTFFSGGVDLDVGLASGAGADGSVGDQVLRISHWDGTTNLDNFSDATNPSEDEASFFRFTNDLGGSVIYGENTNWNQASSGFPSNSQISIGDERSARSSYIGYSTNEKIQENTGEFLANPDASNPLTTGVRPYAYTKREDIHSDANRGNPETSDQIGEFSVVNESGSRYTYGLPVYSKNEENVQVSLSDNLQPTDFVNNFLLYQPVPSNGSEINVEALEAVVGQYSSAPFASTYLLTSITTPDYIDRTQDGPTPDDFGGYTVFNYNKVHGANSVSNDWFNYRTPYAGLNYSRNSFSDPKDDMAGYASGQKEIYYLESIETKTHIARFITSPRYDGVEAEDRTQAADNSLSMNNNLQLRKLDKIILFEKDANGNDGKELQTTFFDYDNSIQSGGGLPNFYNYDGNANGNGKLTLRKVWMEYNDVYKAKIAPYWFHYEYPDFSLPYTDPSFDELIHVDYDGIGEEDQNSEDYGRYEDHINSSLAQNVTYDPLTVDAWGNYQSNTSRYSDYEKWNDQSNLAEPNEDFDPAMWQLKRIVLPSGGQIHIQYEQDDYTFVQHEVAHALVSLDPISGTNGDTGYFLNLDDVGISDPDDIQKYANQISELYVGTGRKMYYKFFYKLLDWDIPQLDDCDSDFITGYFDVQSVSVVGNKIQIVPTDDQLPQKVCKDFVRTQRAGMLQNSSCNPADPNVFDGSDATAFIHNLINFAQSFDPSNKCVNRNNTYSYLRIPIFRGIRTLSGGSQRLQGKRGGGLRVKRLLMYDQDKTNNLGRVLYGSEYHYITKDYEGNYISSGVATNEPAPAREENPMITMMERFKQSFLNRMVAGKDKKQMEGPIGENILPGASVGYSNVIVKGIHSGQTHSGYTEKQFYTAYDCPFYYSDNNANPIDPQWAINKGSNMVTEINDAGTSFPISIPAGIVNFSDHKVKARQGFNFALNNMHGQVKSSATYSNLYWLGNDLKASLDLIEDQNVMIAKEIHEYFGPGEDIPTVSEPNGPVYPEPLGVEHDIAFESKHIKDKTTSVSIEGDGGIGFFGFVPLPFIAVSPSFTSVNNEIYTHVTTKVTNYPAVSKRVSSYQDGIWHVTENLAFDKLTGKPVTTRTYDDFSGNNLPLLQGVDHDASVTAYNYSASMIYDNMGQKAEHENLLVPNTVLNSFDINRIGATELQIDPTNTNGFCDASNALPSGSLVQLSTGFGSVEKDIYHIDYIQDGVVYLQEVSFSDYTSNMDPNISLRIIRSGKTNQLASSAGSVVTYGESQLDVDQPSAAQLSSMNALVSALNSALPNGMVPGSFVESTTSNIDLFFNGECQPFPGSNHHIEIQGNQLNIVQTSNTSSSPLNMPCEDIRPYVLNYLNQYWDAFLKPIDYPDLTDSECKEKRFKIGNDYWYYDMASFTPVEIQQMANDIFSQAVHPELVGTECELLVSDFFIPIFRRPHPVLTQHKKDGKRIYRNGEIIIYDVLLDQYYCVMVECDPEKELLVLYYGVTDGNGIQALPRYTDFAQLEKVAFDPNHDVGSFIAGLMDCMIFKYPDDLTASSISVPISEISTLGMNCGGSEPINKIVCSNDLTNDGTGEFGIETSSGEYNLVYYPFGETCNATFIDVSCLSFCEFTRSVIKNVLNSGFTTYDDQWNFESDLFADNSTEANNFLSQNDYEVGAKGKWRPSSSYAYQEDRGKLNEYSDPLIYEANYNTGVYDLLTFDWFNPDNYAQYKKTSEVTMYSPNGQVLEEKNIINIHSAAKFGYDHMLPYVVAQNSDYQSCLFESFENFYSGYLEDGFVLDPSVGMVYANDAHSGNACLKLLPSNDGLHLHTMDDQSDLFDQGAIVKLWLKSDRSDRHNIAQDLKCIVNDNLGTNIFTASFSEVARTGEWALFEAKLPSNLDHESSLYVRYDFDYAYEELFIDDLRLQPLNSQLSSYVYDTETFRLLASFDDQNFGLFYQYNDEGQLVRQLKETTRGMKTIKESQYNTHEYLDAPW